MKRLFTVAILAMILSVGARAATIRLTVTDNRLQTITGFGAAACWGAMRPIDDVNVIKQLYGSDSPVGLNIVRMEISPNTIGDVTVPWDTPYDWHGYLPVIQEAKRRGAIIFGTPWSPPAEYKTNNSASGGQGDQHGNQRGKLKESYYGKFFTWLNTFCTYMKNNDAAVDAVSIQNEPDWWVDYSGCLYTPEEVYTLVKQYARRLNKSGLGVRLISAESLNFTPRYSDILLEDPETAQYIDIVGGHLYGNPPLQNMAAAAKPALAQGKEVWMTEHSVNPRGDADGTVDLPTWHEQLLFAEELNESMMAGGTAYIYWYMISHWSFIGSGDATLTPGNDYGRLLDRAYIMAHFSKNVTGATRLSTNANIAQTSKAFESTAYIKGDSLIVMAIDSTASAHTLQLTLPYKVKAAKLIRSTEGNLYSESVLSIDEPTNTLTDEMPARSLSTYIFTIADGELSSITDATQTEARVSSDVVFDLQGRRALGDRKGLYIRNGKKIVVP